MSQKCVNPEPNMNVRQGNAGETHQQSDKRSPNLTTQQGMVVADNQNSLKAGRRGPALLEDFILKNYPFWPRAYPWAYRTRGSAAHGYFELTKSLAKFTTAKVLTEVGKIPLFARFSTVAGGAGSVDTPRDIRGFAVKIYTDEGNWDLVGNNTPCIFYSRCHQIPWLDSCGKNGAWPRLSTSGIGTWYVLWFYFLSPERSTIIFGRWVTALFLVVCVW